MRTILAFSSREDRRETNMPTNAMGLLCFVMGLMMAFAVLTPLLEGAAR